MTFLPKDIVALVAAEKLLTFRPQWDDKSDRRNFVITTPLSVDGVIVGGFELRVKVSKAHIDRDGFMQLEFSKGREREELARIQWRPFENHANKAWGPPGYELKRFLGESHYHTFEHNFIAEQCRMRTGNLPAALPIDPDSASLSDFIAFCGKCFRIKNINILRPPETSVDMFWVRL
jgi:hypothetical protein